VAELANRAKLQQLGPEPTNASDVEYTTQSVFSAHRILTPRVRIEPSKPESTTVVAESVRGRISHPAIPVCPMFSNFLVQPAVSGYWPAVPALSGRVRLIELALALSKAVDAIAPKKPEYSPQFLSLLAFGSASVGSLEASRYSDVTWLTRACELSTLRAALALGATFLMSPKVRWQTQLSTLNASPYGLRRAALRARPQIAKNHRCHGPCAIEIVALSAS